MTLVIPNDHGEDQDSCTGENITASDLSGFMTRPFGLSQTSGEK